MKYPINEEQMVIKWLAVLDDPDAADREFLTAIAKAINRAYMAGRADMFSELAHENRR